MNLGLFKTKKSMVTAIVAALALIAVVILAIVLPKEVEEGSMYYGTFMSLVPPIIAIGLALITKEVFSSLFAGVLVGALFASNYSFSGTLDIIVVDGLSTAVADSAGIFVFLVILGILGLGGFVENGENAVGRREGGLEFVEDVREFIDGTCELTGILNKLRYTAKADENNCYAISGIYFDNIGPIKVSAGVADWPNSTKDQEKLLVLAEQAMCLSKSKTCETGQSSIVAADDYNFWDDEALKSFADILIKRHAQIGIDFAKGEFSGLLFANLNDFDSLYGHRRDQEGYKKALEEFNYYLPILLKNLKKDDLLIIAADHGNDPTYKGTDHTRENIPVLMYSPSIKGAKHLADRESFADVGATILDNFKIKNELGIGKSLFEDLREER